MTPAPATPLRSPRPLRNPSAGQGALRTIDMKRRNSIALGLLTLGSVALAPSAAAQTTHTVNLNSFSFSPSSLTIDMGDTVDFVWVVGNHNVVSGVGGTADGAFNSGLPQFGPNTFSVIFDADFLADNTRANNVYNYYCDVHLLFGMTGTITVRAPMAVSPIGINLATGGAQTMTIDAGVANAGQFYWVFGTTAGFSPGFLGLPLNFSNYLLFTINSPNTLIANQFSVLDGMGKATATLTLPAGLDPMLAGIEFHHAFAAFTLSGTTLLISNASSLLLVFS